MGGVCQTPGTVKAPCRSFTADGFLLRYYRVAFARMRSVYFSFFPSLPLPPSDPHIRELFRLFASVRGRKEAELLLRDILTPRELQDVAERWQIVKALHRGTPQRAIAEELGTSLATVTRGSRMLQYGGGGFVRFLRKMKKRTKD